MAVLVHTPETREEWLELRYNDVTASEVSALFGTGYMSEYELWHAKKNRSGFTGDNERMKWGRRLEKSIAEGICEDEGLKLIDTKVRYFSDTERRMGATPDFLVEHPSKGVGVLQIKNVDSLIFKQRWTKPQDGGEAPDYIEMQIQQEMFLAGAKWGKIGVLVGGNQGYVYDREFYPEVAAGLETKVAAFWKSIEANTPPPPDFVRDADFIIEMLAKTTGGKTVDLTGNERIEALARQYEEWSKKHTEADEMRKSIKAEILQTIGDAEVAYLTGGKISCKEVKGNPGTLVTPDMVGTYLGGRSGYRGFRVTVNKGE